MPAASLPTLEQHLEARLTTALTERLSQASTVLLLLVSSRPSADRVRLTGWGHVRWVP